MSDKIIPIINYERCDRCGFCVSTCPEDALQMTEDGPIFNQPITCTFCTACEEVCPHRAIRTPLIIAWGAGA
jgi:formate hydrogenlyase subunit 6/NADH:ubiquinone oxidoreductase subunit I